MKYKDILIQLASMTVPYVYDNTISFLELDRKLYKIVHELIVAMQGLSNNYDALENHVDEYFNNLNLSSEVQTIINKMVEDGTIAEIINSELFDNLNQEISTINESITGINKNITELQNSTKNNTDNITNLEARAILHVAECNENANYFISDESLEIKENDILYIHFNPAIVDTSDATLTINSVARNVINKEGSLFKGQDLENKDLILKVSNVGLIQIVDVADLQKQINDINNNFNKNVFDFIYPVGSIIYNEDENFNPNTIFGGTWEKIKGKMIFGYDEGDDDFSTLKKTGGSKSHTQTVEEMPSHYHDMGVLWGQKGGYGRISGGNPSTGDDRANIQKSNVSAGGGQPMNIMNPYYVANIWRRVA